MAVHLTEPAIRKAAREVVDAKQRRDLADAGCEGLRLRLTPAGGKSWVLACRDREGRMRRFPLGPYGDKEGTLGVAKAREAAVALRSKVKQEGADPVAERRRERAIGREAKAGIGTLGALLSLYENAKGSKLKSWTECRRRIESVFAAHLSRPLAMLKLADLQLAADSWPSQQSAAAAVRYLRPILKWAAHRRYGTAELATITPPATVGRRDRVLSRDELAALLPALKASDRPYAAAMRFLLQTLARREEVAAARWRDVDLAAATWTIPETKNGQPHVVPLPRQAVALLRDRLPRDKHGEAVKPAADALVFTTGSGGPLANWDRETKVLMEASGTEGWTRHDLRRTGATMLGEMGELPDIIEAALNHVAIRSQLAATYNRSRYRPQVAAALQRLVDALDGIEAGAALVVPLRPTA
jgi:integrase